MTTSTPHRIDLIPLTPDHFDALIAWSTTPEFLLQWAGPSFGFPLDHEQLHAVLDLARESPPELLLYAAIESGSDEVIGHAELGRIDHAAGHASLMRILVGSPAARGQGVGSAIVRELIRIGFDELGLDRLYLNVLRNNEAAQHCYMKLGFVPCAQIVPRDPEIVECMVRQRAR